MARTPRPTQAERRQRTRQALLDAALELLVDGGVAGFTTNAVAQRASLSQGALFRYFPTKADLVAATVRELFVQLSLDYEDRFMSLPESKRTAQASVDALWAVMSDPRLHAAFELYAAARTDAELQATLTPVLEEHGRRIYQSACDALPHLAQADHDRFAAMVGLTVFVLQGLALNQLAAPDAELTRNMLAVTRAVVGVSAGEELESR
jgi:AcrR family transcriptional regulator